jgi:hypothetical protein
MHFAPRKPRDDRSFFAARIVQAERAADLLQPGPRQICENAGKPGLARGGQGVKQIVADAAIGHPQAILVGGGQELVPLQML